MLALFTIETKMFCFAVLFSFIFVSLPAPGVLQGNGDLRLAGESLIFNHTDGIGRVEIFLDGQWGTMCGPIDRYVANAICHQLNFGDALLYGSIQNVLVTPSNNSTPILIYVEECPWYNNPLHVLRCDYTKDVSDCGHQYDAAVHCDEGGYGVTYDSEVRLIDGTWSSSGVLEVYIQDEGKWGTICSTDFNQEAADSACRQVGYTNAIGYNGVDNPSGSTPWISSAKCSKSQPCLTTCFNYPSHPLNHCSGQGTVASVNCTFDVSKAPSLSAGNSTACLYIPPLPNEKHYILLGVGIGAAMLALFVIVFIVVAIVVLLKIIYTSKKRSQYVRVDSTSGDAIN